MISQIVMQKMHRLDAFIALELFGHPSQHSLNRRILKGVANSEREKS
jgi:hypothetical protein